MKTSKTVWGIIVLLISLVFQVAGINVDLSPAHDGLTLIEGLNVAAAILVALGVRLSAGPIQVFGRQIGERKAEQGQTKGTTSTDIDQHP